MSGSDLSLAGQLLIAMPNLADPNFHRSVVLIGAHSPQEGSFGLVINRPLDIRLAAVLDELGEDPPSRELPDVLAGGPVETSHGFVLFESTGSLPDPDVLQVDECVAMSGSSDVLSELVHRSDPARYYLVLGYAGWHPGQLEREIEENAWVVAPLTRTLLFETPVEERWSEALRSLGINPGALVDLGDAEPT